MSKTKYIGKTVLFVLLIPLGIFLFIFGEYDDSPGGQLLGVIMSIIGIIGIIRNNKKYLK